MSEISSMSPHYYTLPITTQPNKFYYNHVNTHFPPSFIDNNVLIYPNEFKKLFLKTRERTYTLTSVSHIYHYK